ncbi:MAG: hypothetical protein Tsb0032_18280 [Kiloniellaceae bacterium]
MPKDKSGEGADGAANSPEGDNLQELARRYVDLWQDQMTALASDPEFADSLQKVMAAMGVAAGGLPAIWSAWPAAMSSVMAAAQPGMTNPQGQETHGAPTGGTPAGGTPAGRQENGAAAPGAAAAAAASHGGGADLGGLEERLAALEQRVRELEGSLEGRSGRSRGSPKKSAKRN